MPNQGGRVWGQVAGEGDSSGEIGISAFDLCSSLGEICIFLPEIHKSLKEVCISLGDLHI